MSARISLILRQFKDYAFHALNPVKGEKKDIALVSNTAFVAAPYFIASGQSDMAIASLFFAVGTAVARAGYSSAETDQFVCQRYGSSFNLVKSDPWIRVTGLSWGIDGIGQFLEQVGQIKSSQLLQTTGVLLQIGTLPSSILGPFAVWMSRKSSKTPVL